MSPDKILKVGAFTKEWVKKLITRSKKPSSLSKSSSSSSKGKGKSTPSSRSHLPNLANDLTPSTSPFNSTTGTPDTPSKNSQADDEFTALILKELAEEEMESSPSLEKVPLEDQRVSNPVIEPLAMDKWKVV